MSTLAQRIRFFATVARRRWSYARSKAPNERFMSRMAVEEIARAFPSPDEQWEYLHHFFWHLAPAWLREHRAFFAAERRGFGEDAIHAMWYLLLSEMRPRDFLEIGVYRGQVISLAKLVAAHEGYECRVLGISPFTPAGDSVSAYGEFDYERDVREYCERFGTPLAPDELMRALSTDPSAAEAVRSRRWDVAYIDGNHEYEVARSDFELVAPCVTRHGVVVLDDAALETGYHPRPFSFAGHPGPSRLLTEIKREGWGIVIQGGHNVVLHHGFQVSP